MTEATASTTAPMLTGAVHQRLRNPASVFILTSTPSWVGLFQHLVLYRRGGAGSPCTPWPDPCPEVPSLTPASPCGASVAGLPDRRRGQTRTWPQASEPGAASTGGSRR